MPKKLPHITGAELRILKVLWRIESGTVRDVREILGAQEDPPPAYTTVMTLMNQLADKGGLSVDRTRQPFLYRPAVRRETVLSHRLKQFLHTVFDGQVGELVLKLVEEADLEPEDLKRIEAKITARENMGSVAKKRRTQAGRKTGSKKRKRSQS